MKLVAADGSSRPILKYALPVKFTLLKANVDEADIDVYQTEWKGIIYSYFVLKNVAVYVAGAMSDGPYKVEEMPEGFGASEPPAPRKQYTAKKPVEYEPELDAEGKPVLNEDGSPRYKLDAEGNPIVKVKPPRAKKEPKAKTPKANGDNSDPAAVAQAIEAQEAATEAPVRRRRNSGGEAAQAAA
jgi:hypothetical protein